MGASEEGVDMQGSRWGWLGYLSAGAFVVATVTYGATALEIVGPTEPIEKGPLETRLSNHLANQRDGFGYEQLANWSFVASLLSLGLLVVACHARGIVHDRLVGALASALAVTGTGFAAAAQVIYLGGMERVLYSSQFQEVDVVALTVGADAISRIDDVLESLGSVLIGLALVALLGASRGDFGGHAGLRGLTAAFAIGTFAAAATSLARSDAHDWVLLVVGLLIAPVWTVWVGTLLPKATDIPRASP